ncbi:PREDICTED: FAS-associated factor 1 isoform X1 [Diuraphis noxia]|uniref:FAS-associated factor 1 isoform X1 n=1 Tax=Diuraphis noxia TaxID=143948 RepID=UPI000763AAE1|nr:PREDICTED: FAS-associated factor 1 isoform X1 [Diuraphis noxia]
MDDKNGIIADFQAITGIDNAGEALMHLSNFNWDLLAAVQHVTPQHTQHLPSEGRSTQLSAPTVMIADDFSGMTASTSNETRRLITIEIEQNGHIIATLKVNDGSTIDDLKTLVYAECNIPCCLQNFNGWPNNQLPSNKDTLSKLNLPDRFKLNLMSGNEDLNHELNGRANLRMFTLNITMEATTSSEYQVYKLSFSSDQTVAQVKEVVASLTKLPVSNQQWLGWPHFVTPATTLEESHINYPVHDFKLKPSNSILKHTRRRYNTRLSQSVIDMETSDSPMPSSSTSSSSTSSSSSEEDPFEDAAESLSGIDDDDDDVDTMFMDTEAPTRIRPLIAEDTEDELAGCIQFIDEFQNRYGDMRPQFFLGTLDQAIKIACFKPAKDKRLLAVYLHHDRSVLSNVFCTQLLCFESVVQYLNTNFLVWGWDMTHPSNRNRLLQSASLSLGTMAEITLRAIDINRLPALVLFTRNRSNTEILSVINGDCNISELLSSLINAQEMFAIQQQIEIKEEGERNMREMIKVEQDEAYQQSLAIDRAKEETKRVQEMEEKAIRSQIESQERQVAAEKEAIRQRIVASLPAEPEPGDQVTKIRFRLPLGKFLERRFQASDNLQVLFDYLFISGFSQEEFKVISSWPRRDLTTLGVTQTLKELNLYPQETLTLEER